MNKKDMVSIVIVSRVPTWFDAALKSALVQDHDNIEVIVADISKENYITEIVAPYLNEYDGKLIHLRINPEDGEVYERCIRVCKGTFIKFLSDADVLEYNCVSVLASYLQRIPSAVMAASRRQRIGPRGEKLPDILSTSPFLNEDSIIPGREILRYQSSMHYSLIGELSAVMIRKATVEKLLTEEMAFLEINGRVLQETEALSLYAKVLPEGDLVWCCQNLVNIRVSKIYTQPGQRESFEHIVENRNIVHGYIINQPWYEANVGSSSLLNVASIDSPDSFKKQNIISQQLINNNLSALDSWSWDRKIPKYHQGYLNALGRLTITVFIDAINKDAIEINKTLISLSQDNSIGLIFSPVILAEEQLLENVRFFKTTKNNKISSINKLVSLSIEDWVMLIDAGDEVLHSGMIALAASMKNVDNISAVFADEFFYIENKPEGVLFRPDFNLDIFLSSPKLMSQHWIYNKEVLLKTDGFDEDYTDSFEYGKIIDLIKKEGFSSFGHIAEPLLKTRLKNRNVGQDVLILSQYLNHRGFLNGDVALGEFGNYRLRYETENKPKVSIVILANWNLASLISCTTSILEKTHWPDYELIIVVDNHSTPERSKWLAGISNVDPSRIHVEFYHSDYHHSAMANVGAMRSTSDYLIFIHSEIAFIDSLWLESLMNHACRPEVAIVGGKQVSGNNKIRHAGYILGVNGAACEVFRGWPDDKPTFMGRLHLDQNYSAVSGDFMLVKKTIFNQLAGFDQSMRTLDDVDFCLRARNEGYLTVWTPYSKVFRKASRVTPFPNSSLRDAKSLIAIDEDRMYQRWMPIISNDPAFNSNISKRSRNFDIDSVDNISWNPVVREGLPKILVNHADVAGCGYYRMIFPFEIMQEEGFADGQKTMSLLGLTEVAKFQPDSIVIQRRLSPAFHSWMARLNKFNKSFKVFELDDYILNLPVKNHHRKDMISYVAKNLRTSLSYFDRFVVSTEPLAEAFSDYHSNIVVMKNKLPHVWWGQLKSLRNQGKKTRVGWAGGSSHTGDLEMIAGLVKEFAGQVEWVFFGMCPDRLRPFVDEIHWGVDIELYPETLASLNLDLALAPLEDNFFNICKSNLRLMEYGACGIPVICSDVECYRGDLPVTRVKNKFSDWRDAINMHLDNPEASANMGSQLKEKIFSEWMLTRHSVDDWSKAWTSN